MSFSRYPKQSNEQNPSKVLYVKYRGNDTNEVDLSLIVPYLTTFGQVAYIVSLPKYRQALIEMEDIDSSKRVIDNLQGRELVLNGKAFVIEFSFSPTLNRDQPVHRG